jgi:hypothetical protein
MKSNELRNLIRQEVKSLLKENITPDSSPQEILDYANDIRTKLAAKIDAAVKTLKLQVKAKKEDWHAGGVQTLTINGQKVQTMQGEELQLHKIGSGQLSQLMKTYKVFPEYINRMLISMSQGDQEDVQYRYDMLMNAMKRVGL